MPMDWKNSDCWNVQGFPWLVQCLRPHTPSAGDSGSISGRGTKIPHAWAAHRQAGNEVLAGPLQSICCLLCRPTGLREQSRKLNSASPACQSHTALVEATSSQGPPHSQHPDPGQPTRPSAAAAVPPTQPLTPLGAPDVGTCPDVDPALGAV